MKLLPLRYENRRLFHATSAVTFAALTLALGGCGRPVDMVPLNAAAMR